MQGNALFGPILMYVAIGAIFYFILLRPQQKQRKQHEELLRSLKKGDEIVTAGGLVGKVVHIAAKLKDGAPTFSPDDRVTIETGDTRVVVERGRIARVIAPGGAA